MYICVVYIHIHTCIYVYMYDINYIYIYIYTLGPTAAGGDQIVSLLDSELFLLLGGCPDELINT